MPRENGLRETLIIRKAEAGDYEALRGLVDLEIALHYEARPDYFKKGVRYARKEYEELLARPCPIAWLAVQDSRIVGLCFGKIRKTPENDVCHQRQIAFIEDLYVLLEYRRQGIATALLTQAQQQAQEEGARSFELCVWGFNEQAFRLYERLGMHAQYCRMEKEL